MTVLGNDHINTKGSKISLKEEYKDLFAGYTLQVLIDNFHFSTILDVGSGEGKHSDVLIKNGKKVTAVDFGKSIYFNKRGQDYDRVSGDYFKMQFDQKFDAIWASHVLEHQPNPNLFLQKIFNDLKTGGYLAVTVPPLKHELVGGHVTLWNAGLLLYQLILAGFDCSQAHVRTYDYNISVIIQKKSIDIPELHYDSGDINRLYSFFPSKIKETSCGLIDKLNWDF